MALNAGTILQHRYRIVRLLGQGGMGAVYRAWDTRLNVPVALKEMIPQPGLDAHTLARLRQQFQQEATVLARLKHPHLVRVTDFFEEGGNVYLVMEFVEGENLAECIGRAGVLPEPQVLVWARQLLDALAYCHAQGVIHRDVKPQNVIIQPDGQAVLVDFGLVKLWDPRDPRTRTMVRGMGTPEYSPPEQYEAAAGHTDPRSDLYSLGATLYHALTGQPPPTAMIRTASPSVFQPPRVLNPRISLATEAAVLRALELAVENRFATAQEMAAALGGRVPTTPVTPARRAAVPLRGHQWLWALGGLALVLLMTALVGGVAILVGGRSSPTLTPLPTLTAVPTVPPAPTLTPVPPVTPRPTSAPTIPPAPTSTLMPTVTSLPTSAPTSVPTRRPAPTGTPTPLPTPTMEPIPTAALPTPVPPTPVPPTPIPPTPAPPTPAP